MILSASTATAQDKKPLSVPFEGPQFFAHILHSAQLEPVRSIDDLLDDPPSTLLVAFGSAGPHETDFHDRVSAFRNRGGNVLIATDYTLNLKNWHVNVTGHKVIQPDRSHAFGDSKMCPWLTYGQIESGVNAPRPVSDHPLFHFLRHGIATNRPSGVLLETISTLEPLLPFPSSVFVTGQIQFINMKKPPPKPPTPFYMVGSGKNAPPEGRVLIVAGHGMFTNGMMLQPDTDNFDFSGNAVRWLSEAAEGRKRTKALFLVDGEIITNFDMKLTPSLPPIPLPTVSALNRLIRGLEEERFFQRVLNHLLGDHVGRFISIVLALATFLVFLYGTKKFLDGRVQLDVHAPAVVGVASAATAADPIAERSRAKLRQGDYGEESRLLAQQWLHAEFGDAAERWPPEAQVEFAIQGFFWSRRKLARATELVLRLVRAREAASVSRREFLALVAALRDLTQARQEGALALLVDGKNVRKA